MRRLFTVLILCLLPTLSMAQFYPEYSSTEVNDFAGLLDDTQEAEIAAQLTALRKDTGIQMTLLTLSRQETFAPDMSLEDFATGLFNHWGIGDKTRNDGILVMILREDRAMRIELGKAFGHTWDRSAEKVVQGSFLPSFRDGNYPKGIAIGVEATIEQIARPFHGGAEAPKSKDKGGLSAIWVILIGAGVSLAVFGRKLLDGLARFKTCPSCGQKGGLRVSRKVQSRATQAAAGSGLKTTTCSNCDYRDSSPYVISRRSKSSSSRSFGGGSSGGGGASGRW